MKLHSTLSLTLVVTAWVAIHVGFSPAVLADHKGKPHGGGGGKDDGNDPVAGSWDVTLSGDMSMATRRTGCVGTTVAVRKTVINMPFLQGVNCFVGVDPLFGGVLAIAKAKGKKPDLATMFFQGPGADPGSSIGYRLDMIVDITVPWPPGIGDVTTLTADSWVLAHDTGGGAQACEAEGNFTTTVTILVEGRNCPVECGPSIDCLVNDSCPDDCPNGAGGSLEAAQFLRGDADGQVGLHLTDSIFVLNYLFLGGSEPPCVDAADVDDNGEVNIADATSLLSFLFLGGQTPPAPGPNTCGADPTEDPLDCHSFSGCQ